MRSCGSNWDGSLNEPLVQALEMNRAIWSVLQAELMNTGNPLPQPVKVNLLKLSRIVDRVTFEIMAEPAADKLELLIDINVGIAEGLLSGPGVYRGPQTMCA
jgi:flagellar protein FlaF